ncbi:hypothetical protein EJ06DRAFT_525849 [Trichodelitschia bisporula]|uniref:Xylanolytic transcriptional activator regulatory domain-containing protein n=1 Tax=Trichodelitschia bisporula TaxID=703511 RepID=A0A6G1IAI7_9PEZI|nr:hypothetical protein EJ06DRAFT_525849 [Trichodelitschia bisporula]
MHDRPAAGYEGRELRNHHLRSWTSVTDDGDFIEHLISTYFAWQHSFFQSFPERLFWSDIRTGGTKYCSKFLVNAMCAVGCLLSDRPESRQDPDDPRTAGIDFYEEALRLQAENTTSDVTTVAGLVLLSHLDGHRGRLSLMWSYCGQSARMALDLGLHLRKDKPLGEQQKQQQWSEAVVSETMVRNQVFWGAFIADQLVSFTLGRLPQIPTSAVTVDMPQVREGEDGDMWMPPNPHLRARSPASISTVFYEVARLSKILNSTLLMFFAPTEAIKGSLLLDEYNKYLAWYHRLPTAVASLEDAPPHILTLHMYYHAAILLLFRPFLKATLTNSPISPSEICRTAANYISDIAMRYRRQYGVAGLHAFQPHCLVAACTIHIVNMPSIASTSYLKAACEILQEMTFRNEWALGGLGMLRAIVRKWGIILPGDVEEALYGPGAADADADPPWTASVDDRMDVDSTTPTVEAQRARGKRPIYRGLLAAEMPKHTKLAVPRGLGSLMNESSGESATTSATSGSSSIRSRGTEQVNPSGAGAGSPGNTNYLFTPFPSQPAPLLMPIHTSTAGGESEVVIQELEGLNFEGNDWFDQFLGYSGEE